MLEIYRVRGALAIETLVDARWHRYLPFKRASCIDRDTRMDLT